METSTKEKVKLSKEIKIQGSTATQIKRTGNIAIYERGYNHYEVIKIPYSPKSTIKGIVIRKEGERYPSTSEWGKMAWTYIQRINAEKKFDELLKETN